MKNLKVMLCSRWCSLDIWNHWCTRQ